MAQVTIAERVTREADRLDLSDIELAALIGMSVPHASALRRGGKEPVRMPTRRAVLAFLDRAERARSRADLTLPAVA